MNVSNRRRFLKYAGLGSAALIAGGIGWQFRPTTPADFPEDRPLSAGDGRSLLVVYGSMMGSTGQQARWMAENANSLGYRTQLARAENAPPPDEFDAVLFGSAIQAGQWVEPALDWARRHGDALAAKPHGLFQCSMTCAGMLMSRPDGKLAPEQKAELTKDLAALHEAAPRLANSPVEFFPGRLEFARLTPVLRLGYPIVSGSIMDGDHRRPEAVQDWSSSVLG